MVKLPQKNYLIGNSILYSMILIIILAPAALLLFISSTLRPLRISKKIKSTITGLYISFSSNHISKYRYLWTTRINGYPKKEGHIFWRKKNRFPNRFLNSIVGCNSTIYYKLATARERQKLIFLRLHP